MERELLLMGKKVLSPLLSGYFYRQACIHIPPYVQQEIPHPHVYCSSVSNPCLCAVNIRTKFEDGKARAPTTVANFFNIMFTITGAGDRIFTIWMDLSLSCFCKRIFKKTLHKRQRLQDNLSNVMKSWLVMDDSTYSTYPQI